MGRNRRHLRWAVLGSVLALIAVAVGFSTLWLVSARHPASVVVPSSTARPTGGRSGQPTAEPTEGSQPSASRQPEVDQLSAFAAQCGATTAYRSGRVLYPRTLTADLGEATTYGAAVDVRDSPAAPGDVIPGPDPTSEPVLVQCVIGARLVEVGPGISVENDDAAADGGWRYQQFTPAGVLEWSWSVTPLVPRRQELRLELRPVVEVSGDLPVPRTTTTQFVTRVEVHANWIQRLSYWFSTAWPQLAAVAAILAGALTAVLIFTKETRTRITELRASGAKRRPTRPPRSRPRLPRR
jgi:hypothetical protein